jgi:hypothetical protein
MNRKLSSCAMGSDVDLSSNNEIDEKLPLLIDRAKSEPDIDKACCLWEKIDSQYDAVFIAKLSLSRYYYSKNILEKAILYADAAVQLNEIHVSSRIIRARICARLELWVLANKDWKVVFTLSEGNPNLAAESLRAMRFSNNIEFAKEFFLCRELMDQVSVSFLMEGARFFLAMDEVETSIGCYFSAFRFDDYNKSILKVCVRELTESGYFAQASAIQKFSASSPAEQIHGVS